MNNPVLTLRISRRAIGAAVLTGEELSFIDGRHLTSAKSRAVPAALRYINRVVDLVRPRSIVVDAPREPGSTTDQILEELLKQTDGSPVEVLPVANLLVAFGFPALETRADLRAAVLQMFPQFDDVRLSVKPFLLDASAAALHAESATALAGRE